MMKVAFVVPSLCNKGPVIVVKYLVDYLVVHGVYCEVFYFSNIKELEFKCQTTNIKITDFAAVKDFCILHTHGIRPDLYSFLNPNKSIKRISTLHNYIANDLQYGILEYSKMKSIFFEFIWNVFLIRNNKIIVLSQDAVRYYKKILFNKKIDYIYNGLNLDAQISEIPEQQQLEKLKLKGMTIIGTCAYLIKEKGLNQIIKILPYFRNMIFIILGDGPEKNNLIQLAIKLKVSKQCLFLGYKPNASSYLKFFDFYTIPSYCEGFGLALIEATASKKATLVSDINIFREIYTDKEVSFAKLDNKQSMISAINRLVENKSDYEKNCYRKYKSLYTLEMMGKKYLNTYIQILELDSR